MSNAHTFACLEQQWRHGSCRLSHWCICTWCVHLCVHSYMKTYALHHLISNGHFTLSTLVSIYIYIYIYTHTHTLSCLFMHLYAHACMCTGTYIYTHELQPTSSDGNLAALNYSIDAPHIYVYVLQMYMHTHAQIHKHKSIFAVYEQRWRPRSSWLFYWRTAMGVPDDGVRSDPRQTRYIWVERKVCIHVHLFDNSYIFTHLTHLYTG
jgi:hypothetical protein